MKKIWIRLGTTVQITDAEERAIFADDGEQMREVLRRVIAEGRFRLDGESYVPSEAVQDFNRAYGTSHEEEIWWCDL